jgi:hypothetical protein
VIVLIEGTQQPPQRSRLRRVDGVRGRFEAVAPQLAADAYHASIVNPVLAGPVPSCDFTVGRVNAELRHLTMNEQDLRHLAERSGGRFYPLVDADKLIGQLPAGQPRRVESLTPVPLWNSWVVALVFVVTVVAEWSLRRRFGMS